MRNAFAKELTALAATNEDLVMLSGDIGNRLFDEFKQRFPDRFFNCGVAEANMTGLATGMAMSGLRPITYTITPFATTRCLEQIRTDLCYHNVPVIVVGVGGGLSYAELGPSHHSCEDIAFLRSIPNMEVICPGDPVEVKAALRAAIKRPGPVYIRLGKKGEPIVHEKEIDFVFGKMLPLREGKDICLISTGNTLALAEEVVDSLEREGCSSSLVSCHTVKPLDTAFLEEAAQRYSLLVSLEEHSLIGGLGSSLAEYLVDLDEMPTSLLRLGLRDEFYHPAGSQNDAREYFSLNTEKIVERVLRRYAKLEACSV